MHCGMTYGKDTSDLGRWVWHQYQGKDGIALRAVSAYQPNGPGKGGPYTIYAQHLQHLL